MHLLRLSSGGTSADSNPTEAKTDLWKDTIPRYGGYMSVVTGIGVLVANATAFFFRGMAQYETWYLIIVNFLLLIGALFLFQSLYNKQRRLLREQRDAGTLRAQLDSRDVAYVHIFGSLENLFHKRTGISKQVHAVLQGQSHKSDLRRDVNDYIHFLLNQAKEVFDNYTKDESAVCVKLFTEHKNFDGEIPSDSGQQGRPQQVFTIDRDFISKGKREYVDKEQRTKEYLYTDNTAFLEIMTRASNLNYFYNNDLAELRRQGFYDNTRLRWDKDYNATAVHAIKDPELSPTEGVIGFICADNMKGGFDDKICKHILGLLADTLYYVFSTTSVVLRR